MPKVVYSLTDSEIEIVRRGLEDPNLFLDYFLRPKGKDKGWQFDDNFDPEHKWQEEAMLATQKNIIISGGVGSGKTYAVAVTAMYFAATISPDFKFLNAAPVSNQAIFMYQAILNLSTGCPYEKLIYSVRARPYPQIVIRFKIGDEEVKSTLDFMSVDRNAKNIYSYEGDWINLEEGGLLDDLESVINSLGSRLRGSYRGRERMGRLSIITNPWDNAYFWYMFDMAQTNPEDYLSMSVSTTTNKNISPDQLRNILKRIPEKDHEQFIHGSRPTGRGTYFNRESIDACEDFTLTEELLSEVKRGTGGYAFLQESNIGVSYFETPYRRGHQYIVVGDLGTDAAPGRNAPALAVFDVSMFPDQPCTMVAFWWGNGGQSIRPFIKWLFKFCEKYNPIKAGVDSTSTQKYVAEMLNTYIKAKNDDAISTLIGEKIVIPENLRIIGLDFSGGNKPAYLRSLTFLLEDNKLKWPYGVTGLRSQLSNYDPERDSARKGVIPQDLVAVLSMFAYVVRMYYYAEIEKVDSKDAVTLGENYDRNTKRLSNSARTRRSDSRTSLRKRRDHFNSAGKGQSPDCS